jgi:hypothetical protein
LAKILVVEDFAVFLVSHKSHVENDHDQQPKCAESENVPPSMALGVEADSSLEESGGFFARQFVDEPVAECETPKHDKKFHKIPGFVLAKVKSHNRSH